MVDWNSINNKWSEAVLQSGRFEELLTELGCELNGVPGGTVFRGPCPVHHGLRDNFKIETDGDTVPIRWSCFSKQCHKHKGIKPNLLGLVRGVLSDTLDELVHMSAACVYVRKFLARAPSRTPTCGRPGWVARAPATRKLLSLTRHVVRSRLTLPSPYFLARGFDPDVLDRFDVGESARLGRAVVPIYDHSGDKCIGFTSRALVPACRACSGYHVPGAVCNPKEPRWKFERGFPCDNYLYNYAAVARSDSPFVLLVEGPPDVFRATEADIPAVACFGSDISVWQTHWLGQLLKKVVVAFDNDPVGQKKGAEVVALLQREGIQSEVCHPPDGVKDVGEMTAAEVKGRFVITVEKDDERRAIERAALVRKWHPLAG